MLTMAEIQAEINRLWGEKNAPILLLDGSGQLLRRADGKSVSFQFHASDVDAPISDLSSRILVKMLDTLRKA